MVLKNAKPAIKTKGEKAGQPSKNRAVAPEDIMREASARVHALLASFPLYPEIDLDFLMEEFLIAE